MHRCQWLKFSDKERVVGDRVSSGPKWGRLLWARVRILDFLLKA